MSPIESTESAEHGWRCPLDLLRHELLALEPSALRPINVDVVAAASLVIGSLPEIGGHRDALVALVGEQNARPLDRLELIARAAIEAHARYIAADDTSDLTSIGEPVARWRKLFGIEVRSLIMRGFLPRDILFHQSCGRGYKNVSIDVLSLVVALRASWSTIESRTSITVLELDQAEAATNRLLTAVGERQRGISTLESDLRQRAFTLLVDTYEETRRLIAFLRWYEGDVEEIVPCVFNARRKKRTRRSSVPADAR
jgi:hypothetical protein